MAEKWKVPVEVKAQVWRGCEDPRFPWCSRVIETLKGTSRWVRYGYPTEDEARTALDEWLKEQGAVRVEEVGSGD